MEKVKLILGNISFVGDFAYVHEIKGILECPDSNTASEIGEDLCNIFESYLIPSEWKGSIVYESGSGLEMNFMHIKD